MNQDTGEFVTGDDMKPGMNRYTVGEEVKFANGDRFVVIEFENVSREGETRGEIILRAMKVSEMTDRKKAEATLSNFLGRNDNGTPTNRKQRRARKHQIDKVTRKIQKRDQLRGKR